MDFGWDQIIETRITERRYQWLVEFITNIVKTKPIYLLVGKCKI